MEQVADYTPRDVIADINYFPATGKVIEVSAWKKRYLHEKDEFTRPMTIRDIRGVNKKFVLDQNGFEVVKLAPKERSTDDDETIKTEYYPELEEITRKMCVARRRQIPQTVYN